MFDPRMVGNRIRSFARRDMRRLAAEMWGDCRRPVAEDDPVTNALYQGQTLGMERVGRVGGAVHEGFRQTDVLRSTASGDVYVMPDTTQIMVDLQPVDRLIAELEDQPVTEVDREALPVYRRDTPPAHYSDQGRDLKVLREMSDDLRRTVHSQLVADLVRLDLPIAGVQLDFGNARHRKGGRSADVHGSTMTEMTGVRALSPDGDLLHRGAVTFLRDTLADEFYCWWEGDGLPLSVWVGLDLGVRRRLAESADFQDDPRVQSFG